MTGWPNTDVKVANDMATARSLVLVFLNHFAKVTSERRGAVMAADGFGFFIAFALVKFICPLIVSEALPACQEWRGRCRRDIPGDWICRRHRSPARRRRD